jgi:hypothetical protein
VRGGGEELGLTGTAAEPRLVYPRLKFRPGVLVRKYVAVPPGATWVDIRVVSLANGGSAGEEGALLQPPADGRLFALHCLQARPLSRYREDELEASVRLESEPGAYVGRAMRVHALGTLEVVLAQWWSALGAGDVALELRFSGVTLCGGAPHLGPHNGWLALARVRADLRDVAVEPAADLKVWLQAVAPARSRLEPTRADSGNGVLGVRLASGSPWPRSPHSPPHSPANSPPPQAYPADSRLSWQATLDYDLPAMDKGAKFKLRLPVGASELLYDSPLEGQTTVVRDARGRAVGWCDYIPGGGLKEFTSPGGALSAQTVFRRENDNKVLERLACVWGSGPSLAAALPAHSATLRRSATAL